MTRKSIRLKFRFTTIVYIVLLCAVLLGWFIDHVRLSRTIDELMIEYYVNSATNIP
jgi:hypothetical protein